MLTLQTSLTGYVLVVEAGCWRMKKLPHPIETSLQQIEGAIEAKLYYLAVVSALTLPDVCAALEDENGYSGREEYKKWYRENLADLFPFMSDADAYSLRCGVVHKGNLGLKTKQARFSRVLFTLPSGHEHGQDHMWHNCVADDCLQFDAILFCREVVEAVRRWCEKTRENEIVAGNLPNLIQFRPYGLAPYFVGMPVIA